MKGSSSFIKNAWPSAFSVHAGSNEHGSSLYHSLAFVFLSHMYFLNNNLVVNSVKLSLFSFRFESL